MTDGAEIAEAARLWELPPEEFTAARDELARELRAARRTEDAAAVKALRKPTRDAWVVNRLIATTPDVVGAVLAVGERLRAAQVQRRGDELRALAADRDRALESALRAAQALCGRLSPAVVDGVRATLHAALADPEAAELVSRGQLSSGLSYAGLGAAPLTAVRPTPLSSARTVSDDAAPAPAPSRKAGPDPREVAAAQARLREAEDELAEAQLARADAQQQVDDLEVALAEARGGLRVAQTEVRSASKARDAAARELSRIESEPS